MSYEKGSLSIHSENIFPIIKKWLYSDHDIFIRELISNACDAITKLRRLSSMGEADLKGDDDFKVVVTLDKENNQLKFTDNGIGMTDEEIKKYINQIAFSGAEDFLQKYKDKGDIDQIIGHFGLGFYSAFMVADKVQIHTLSHVEGSKPVIWNCEGGTDFEMEDGTRSDRGTEITLFLGEEGKDFTTEHAIRATIEKYCSFMPYPIYFEVSNEPKKEGETEEKASEALNDVNPLYSKQPSSCTDEEYREFYKKTFMDFKEPLFWIHLNMDYPFNLKGILYFPKLSTEFDSIEGRIKLYNNQVFVADNVKEVIPEFLLLLKGVIDCPDLPLNVSRSSLQNDGFAKKISDYITKKVADKLCGLFKSERESFEKFWDDINPFVKYGSLKDSKFYDKVEDIIIYKATDDKYVTSDEYVDSYGAKIDGKIYYATDKVQQAQYIQLLQAHDVEALILDHSIDPAFIGLVESKKEKLEFVRVDSDVSELLKETSESENAEARKEIEEKISDEFKKVLEKDDLKVQMESLKTAEVSGMIILSESNRRMQDMMKMYSMPGMDSSMFPSEEVLVLNKKHPLIKYIIESGDENDELKDMVIKQVYDLALMSHKPLSPEAMTAFIKRSNDIMKLMVVK